MKPDLIISGLAVALGAIAGFQHVRIQQIQAECPPQQQEQQQGGQRTPWHVTGLILVWRHQEK
jgi:hypothetical protein